MRTKLSTCRRKRRFPSEADAVRAAVKTDGLLRPYRCDRCHYYHLTSRTKGKRSLLPPSGGREACKNVGGEAAAPRIG